MTAPDQPSAHWTIDKKAIDADAVAVTAWNALRRAVEDAARLPAVEAERDALAATLTRLERAGRELLLARDGLTVRDEGQPYKVLMADVDDARQFYEQAEVRFRAVLSEASDATRPESA